MLIKKNDFNHRALTLLIIICLLCKDKKKICPKIPKLKFK